MDDGASAKVMADGAKLFNDSIHGYIEMHPLCVAIIDTEQFQRLRNIKQMGGTYYVYPGASHNRFEHSIGTSYLAGHFVESLKTKQDELNIDEKDVLCVKVAGLCHDLGHGPFSHMFDNEFIPKVRRNISWEHEVASEKMFDHLVDSNDKVNKMFEVEDLDDKDKNFIKKLMTGEKPKNKEGWEEIGRDESKRFLFEIVANKINGVDVDKFDYFARDCKYLGIKSSFDHMRCIQLARVIECNKEGWPQICYRDNTVGNIYDLFNTRLSIHKKACQHKTGNIVEMMITEALVKANLHLKIKLEENEKGLKMSEAIDEMKYYTKLTDHVYYQILYSTDGNLKESREILKKIEKRELFKFIGYTIPKDSPSKEGVPAMQNEIFDIVMKGEESQDVVDPKEEESQDVVDHKEEESQKDDIIVQLTSFKYGSSGIEEGKNPVDSVCFYAKENENESFKINKEQVSRMLPEVFFENEIRVYCKKREKQIIEKMKKAFDKWCDNRGYQRKFNSYVEREKELPADQDTSADEKKET